MIAFVFLAATFLMLMRRWKPLQGPVVQTGEAAMAVNRNGYAAVNGAENVIDRQQLMELANTDPRHVAKLLSNLMRTNGTP
jgi:hypothetical protein